MGCDTFVIDKWHYCFIRLMLSEDLGSVNLKHEIYMYVCMCGMWLLMMLLLMIIIDETMLVFMIILIWDDVIDDK